MAGVQTNNYVQLCNFATFLFAHIGKKQYLCSRKGEMIWKKTERQKKKKCSEMRRCS